MRLNVKLVVFAAMACLGSSVSASQAGGNTGVETTAQLMRTAETSAHQKWGESLRHTPPPARGCFQASYPSSIWKEVKCGNALPSYSAPPSLERTSQSSFAMKTSSATPAAVGNTNGYVLGAHGPLYFVQLSPPSVTGVTSIVDPNFPGLADQYSLQILTNSDATTPACSTGNAGCTVFQRFVYTTTLAGLGQQIAYLYTEYWLLGYGSAVCPVASDGSIWLSDGNGNCYLRSSLTPAPVIPAANIGQVVWGVGITVSGDFLSVLQYGNNVYSVQAPDRLNIFPVWTKTTFNIFGRQDGIPSGGAQFNAGSSVTINLSVDDDSNDAPLCYQGSLGSPLSIPSNNLNLDLNKGCTTTGGGPLLNSIQFTESN